jgi:hypothetical protein
MDPDAAWTIIEEQRRSLADLLEELTEDQWETPSLCAGWRVRDVSIRHARRPGADLVAELRDHAASRELVSLTDHRNILFDVLVHGQDITLPLGLDRPVPVAAAHAALDRPSGPGAEALADRVR